jgi:hypothetical protein
MKKKTAGEGSRFFQFGIQLRRDGELCAVKRGA